MRIVCIVQSRLGSTRLPRKALADIEGRPMIAHVVARALEIEGVHKVVVATVANDVWPLADACPSTVPVRSYGVKDDDVLGRYVRCARAFHADVVVRVTGDCPLLDPEESSAVLAALGNRDYITNRRPETDGLDTEALTLDALERAHKGTVGGYDREHVTPYIYGHPKLFACAEYRGRALGVKWSIDTAEDLERVRAAMRLGA